MIDFGQANAGWVTVDLTFKNGPGCNFVEDSL